MHYSRVDSVRPMMRREKAIVIAVGLLLIFGGPLALHWQHGRSAATPTPTVTVTATPSPEYRTPGGERLMYDARDANTRHFFCNAWHNYPRTLFALPGMAEYRQLGLSWSEFVDILGRECG